MNANHSSDNAAKTSKRRELTLDIEQLEDRIAPSYFSNIYLSDVVISSYKVNSPLPQYSLNYTKITY